MCPSFEFTLLVSFLITLLCHFCFNRLAKEAEKEKPMDEDLVDSTGLWKSCKSVDLQRVYGNPTCTILFVDSPSSNKTCVCQTVTTAKTHDIGESDFFHQQLEARDTQTTV